MCLQLKIGGRLLFPARAGVILGSWWIFCNLHAFPRASGGDPTMVGHLKTMLTFSPRERG